MRGVTILDRVSGREVPTLDDRAVAGRYLFLPGTRRVVVDGRYAQPGEYHDVGSEQERRLLSDQVTVNAVRIIGERVDVLTRRQAPVSEISSLSPLVDGAAASRILERESLESAIEEQLRYLRAVCFRPVSRLRPVDRLVPVARARRVTARTVTHLAARSEHWATLRPDGIRPHHVLSPERDVDLDLYENRVAAQLIDRLGQYLTSRIGQIREVDRMFGDIQRYCDDIADRPWNNSQRLWQLVADLLDEQDWRPHAEARLTELAKLRGGVSTLRRSPVWSGTNRRAALGTSLRPTNLFTNEEKYRRVGVLWRRWIASLTGLTDEDPASRRRQWYRQFEGYVAVLLLRALEEIGGQAAVDESTLAPGATAVPFRYGSDEVTLRWGADGVFHLSHGGATALRVVPLPHPFTASRGDESTLAELARLGPGEVPPPTAPTLVLYPGTRAERKDLPVRTRLRAFETPGTPAPGQAGGRVRAAPVSPLEVDSVTRLARALRFTFEQCKLADYPVEVRVPPLLGTSVVADIPWLVSQDGRVVVTRIPADHELAAARRRVMALRQETTRFRQQGTNAAEIQQLWDDVEQAVRATTALTRCPRCGASAATPSRALQPRNGGGFYCSCDNCGGTWEARRCATPTCQHLYPILHPPAGAAPCPADGDLVDRRFASHLLAAPCWTRERVYVCPQCGECGNKQNSADCDRCVAAGATMQKHI